MVKNSGIKYVKLCCLNVINAGGSGGTVVKALNTQLLSCMNSCMDKGVCQNAVNVNVMIQTVKTLMYSAGLLTPV